MFLQFCSQEADLGCHSLFGPALQISEWWFALWPQFSEVSKKSHWLSVCSAFFLLWGHKWLTSKLYTCQSWKWKSANFFYKGSNNKEFWICKIHSFCCCYSSLQLECENSYRQYENKRARLCPNKDVFTKTGGGLNLACGPQFAAPALDYKVTNWNATRRQGDSKHEQSWMGFK